MYYCVTNHLKTKTMLLFFIISLDQEFLSKFLDGSGLRSCIKMYLLYFSQESRHLQVSLRLEDPFPRQLSHWASGGCWLLGEASVYHHMDLLLGLYECFWLCHSGRQFSKGLSHLVSRGTQNFPCSALSFQSYLCSKQHWQIETFSLQSRGRISFLSPYIKRQCLLKGRINKVYCLL